MTYTKRQWFIYRLSQCVNFLGKTHIYMFDVMKYVKKSKYNKRFNKINKQIDKCWFKLRELYNEVK